MMSQQEFVSVNNKIITAYEASCKVSKATEQDLAPAMRTALRELERAVLLARNTYERYYPITESDAAVPLLTAATHMTGEVWLDARGWVHIKLFMLLAHCQDTPTPYMEQTILRLLSQWRQNGGQLPWFEQAMVVIDEGSERRNGRVFDQDNKGWKVITNTLKNVLFSDDDQFTVSLVLLATKSEIPYCDITILPPADAGQFFFQRARTLESGR